VTDRYGEVIVVGAGVSGLTTTLVLRRAGFPVRLFARDLPADTTSCNAGAIWGPHMVEHPRLKGWADASLRELSRLAEDTASTGVRLVPGVEASRVWTEQPQWMENLDQVDKANPDEMPKGWAVGWRYTAPIVDMPVYLDYLLGELARHGVRLERRSITSAQELASLGGIVVNCTGLASQDLLNDQALEPIRGDLVRVANPGVDEFFAEHTTEPVDQTYILPQGRWLLLGGTAFAGETLDVADPERDAEIARGILARCAEVEPRLAGVEIVEHRKGLRPSRTEVRVEAEPTPRSTVIHNYGHGGGGITLSWGCAEEVLELVRAVAARSAAPREEIFDALHQPVG
jgi:D-amino-acid oxidase